MSPHHRSQQGFTLIEMMVVVAIIAILSAILISVKSGTYGANTANTSQQIANYFNTCKMRAVSTRRWHRCELTRTTFTMSQWSATGLTTPSGICVTSPSISNCYTLITQTTFDKNIYVSNATTSLYAAGAAPAGVTVSAPSLVFDVDFKPDGSATGGTVFVTDTQANKPWRVVVYPGTGGSYARAGW